MTTYITAMNINSIEYQQAEDWYNAASKDELIAYATARGLDIGQNQPELSDDWNEKVISEKYNQLCGR